MPLLFASTFALLSLTGMLLGILTMVFLFSGEEPISIHLSLGIIIALNFFLWLLGPFFMDLFQKFTYKIRSISIDELAAKNPKSAQIIKQITSKYGYKIPILKMIEDQNPTAYTYGSGRYNARIVFSAGLFHYLTDEEAATVIAHELGHITRRDFIVMSVASTFLQCLYTLYRILSQSKGNGKGKSRLATIGLIAYLFYFIGQYIILYLSRVREYGADEFSVKETKNPNGLSSALLKISYGIAVESKKKKDKGLIKGTQALGISNLKNADQIFTLSQSQDENNFSLPKQDILNRILAFDFVSVWAALSEFLATHPLTGKRIRYINQFCQEFGQRPLLDFSAIEREISTYKSEARSAFFQDFFIWITPSMGLLSFIIGILFEQPQMVMLGFFVFFLAGIWKIKYKYPHIDENSANKDYLTLMQDFTASPVKGKPIVTEGIVAGRGVSGAYFSEDFLINTSRGIFFCNYQSMIPLLGNLLAAFGKIKKLVDNKLSIKVTGWFFRRNTQWVDLSKVIPNSNILKPFNSHPIINAVITHLLISAFLGFVLYTNQYNDISIKKRYPLNFKHVIKTTSSEESSGEYGNLNDK